ncbi:MAG: ATP-binding protein [Acidobacteriota bacterium]
MQLCIMLICIIMRFINRQAEMARLDRLAAGDSGGLAVLYGRRRIGKTRLLLEWTRRHGGLYTVADQSAAEIQRRYFAAAVATRLPEFAEVEYPDWRSLLARLAREATSARWRGPIVFDELPYLVVASPELPSILQRWIDHEAADARLVVAVAGSSQRMMQGLVLSSDAPLYGRARELLDLQPIAANHLREAFGAVSLEQRIELFAAWGGVPRYWELAAEVEGTVPEQIEELALDPMGPLHREPDRLLIEEVPSAVEARPVLDAIGSGAHRISEIGGRTGRPATSMSRPLERLSEMGLVKREVPFGELEKKSRRGLYKIDDPFVRLWFRVVAPHRGLLASSTREGRLQVLQRYWPGLVAQAWEDLCRKQLPQISPSSALGRLGPWGPASRWWKGHMPEWDLVSESFDGRHLLLGEAKWSTRPFDPSNLDRVTRALAAKPKPVIPKKYEKHEIIRALFVPRIRAAEPGGSILLVTAAELIDQG